MPKGDFPSKDGVFKGEKYSCAICGRTFRRYQMVTQRGFLVCRETCKDEPGYKNERHDK